MQCFSYVSTSQRRRGELTGKEIHSMVKDMAMYIR
jgi:hypothetical protein